MKLLRGVLAALMVVWMAAEVQAADEPKKPAVEVGKPAPDFTLKNQEGKDVKLSELKGKKNVLIAFYPKDFTGG